MRVSSAIFVLALLFAAIWPSLYRPPTRAPAVTASTIEWAHAQWLPPNTSVVQWRLSPLEERFARQFPGHIARFKDGRNEWIVRIAEKPTRMLHPATDCFRALGYHITQAHVRSDSRGDNWRCFSAERNGKRLRVCERIFDTNGGKWTDVSSWYWSALLADAARTSGPWWAVTRVEAED